MMLRTLPRISVATDAAQSYTWVCVTIGLLVMYVPTYVDVYHYFWTTREGSYGGVMLGLIAVVIWRERTAFLQTRAVGRTWPHIMLIVIGLLLYVAGRSQTFFLIEVGSQIPLLLGISGLLLNRQGLRRLAIPILLLAFVVPLPGSMLDSFLLPLKQSVSDIIDTILYHAGYPIARNGVVLTIGPYSLLIADACSGLNSMIALSGVGLFYVYLMHRKEWWLNALLIASILPIAYFANLVRVGMLALITYHLGDGAGRSFHDQAAYLEILLAFGLFFALGRAMRLVRS